MEPHKTFDSSMTAFKPDLGDGPEAYFAKALAFTKKFYGEELDRIGRTKFEEVSPEFFFQEYVFVVHATGFSAKAVGKFMPRLMLAYGPWEELGKEPFSQVFKRVKDVCNNPQKARAIHTTASRMVHDLTDGGVPWQSFKQDQLSTPELLAKLPYVGKITCLHLGRNIGLLECVKPDLHLIRMAEHWGFKTCEDMCRAVRPEGMPLGLVDLCLWYSASTWGSLSIKKPGGR